MDMKKVFSRFCVDIIRYHAQTSLPGSPWKNHSSSMLKAICIFFSPSAIANSDVESEWRRVPGWALRARLIIILHCIWAPKILHAVKTSSSQQAPQYTWHYLDFTHPFLLRQFWQKNLNNLVLACTLLVIVQQDPCKTQPKWMMLVPVLQWW